MIILTIDNAPVIYCTYSKRHYLDVQQPYYNMVDLSGAVPDEELLNMIDHAYQVAVGKLPKKYQRELEQE